MKPTRENTLLNIIRMPLSLIVFSAVVTGCANSRGGRHLGWTERQQS